jgi:peptidoglycan/LPS O-acetylase OafA/YrhL
MSLWGLWGSGLRRSHMEYRREIDGLRAVSVLSVIFFHANFAAFSGGFVGVDIFFVISGYLITTILLAEKTSGTFTLVNFYERRARRILPALFVVLFTCLPFAWLWLPPTDMNSFSQSLIAVSGFASNILFYSSTGYFDTAAEWKPLLHTWSLAVEEQYYLFFPLFLMLTWKLGTRWIFSLLIIITITSLIHAHWCSTNNPEAGFYLLPARGWELLIGALVAFYMVSYGNKNFSPLTSQVGSTAGLLLITYSILVFDKHTPFPSLYTLAPTIGAALIILFATSQTITGQLLGYRLLVGIGIISYSTYLWHWPLFVFARHKSIPEAPSQLLLGILAVTAVLLGYLSWKHVESPFRNKQKISRNKIVVSGILCTTFFIAFGLAGHISDGYSNRIPSSDTTPAIEFPSQANGWCFYEPDTSRDLTVRINGSDCWLGNKLSPRKAILIGDSFAGNYEPFWDAIGKKIDLGINPITTNYCVPTKDEVWTGPIAWKAKEQCFNNRRYFVENVAKYDVAIFGGNWMDYSTKNKMESILALIDFAASKTKIVVLMAAPTAYDINPMEVYNKSLLEKTVFDITTVPTKRDTELAKANLLLEETSKKYNNVLYIDRDSMFNVNGVPSEVTTKNIPFSFDGGHISIYGSLSAASSFLQSQKYKDFINMLHSSSPAAK